MKSLWRGAAVLGVLGLALLTIGPRMWPGPRPAVTPRERLAQAIGDEMPFMARLAGGFAAPREGVQRSAAGVIPTLSPDARIALAEMEKRAAADGSDEAQADLGVAYLIQGDVDRAVRMLSDVAVRLQRASSWSDLAAAYLVKSAQTSARRFEFLARALEAATAANTLEITAEGRFNEQVALQGLAPFLGEGVSWDDYVATEHDTRWADAAKAYAAAHPVLADPVGLAKDRAARLRAALERADPSLVEAIVRESPEEALDYFHRQLLWPWARRVIGDAPLPPVDRAAAPLLAHAIHVVTGDATASREAARLATGGRDLASAHLAHADGLAAYASNSYEEARRSFLAAAGTFRRLRSDYADWAEFYVAVIAFQERQFESAEARLVALERRARTRAQRSLLADALRIHGLVLSKQWRIGEALAAFRESAALFEQTGERENVVSVYHQLADTYRTLGEQHRTWQFIARTLEGQTSVSSSIRRYLAYYNASLFASSQQLFEVALRLQSSAVREAQRSTNEVAVVDALTQRALILLRRDRQTAARADMNAAAGRLSSMATSALKQYLESELAVLSAELNPTEAATGPALEQALEFFTRSEPGRAPRLWLALARQRLAAGERDRAIAALQQGIAHLERQQADLGDDALKISFFDDSWGLFEQLLRLQFGQKEFDQAFLTAERSRARLLRTTAADADHAAVIHLGDLQRTLPVDATLVYYVSSPEQVTIWLASRERQTVLESRVTAGELARLVAGHRDAITAGRESATASSLYQHLIAPVASALRSSRTVVIVPDGALQQLPFATLRHPDTGRYLIEDFSILMAPSATVFARGREHTRVSYSSALLVGNPLTDAVALPGAEREAREVAELYDSADVLTGPAATKEQFMRRAPTHDVVHFAGHGYANAEYPLLSRLAFASAAGQEDSLFAYEISSLKFSGTQLVVLAACSTAGGILSRGEGVVSVAWPFLAAGVPQVVASLWDVDDAATHTLFVAFHRVLADTQDAVHALRAAQLSLLYSRNDTLAAPASWGAFVALGTLNLQPVLRPGEPR